MKVRKDVDIYNEESREPMFDLLEIVGPRILWDLLIVRLEKDPVSDILASL